MQKNPKLTKEQVLFSFVLLAFLPIIFYFMNFDRTLNVDYLNYKQNYVLNWKQFEYAYSLVESCFQFFKADFDIFWYFLLCSELLMIVMLYHNRYVFLLAVPNLLYLSQGMLGTQVRFGVAVLFSLLLFRLFVNKKYYYYLAPFGILLHNGVIVFVFLAGYCKLLINNTKRLFYKRNFYSLFLSVILFLSISFFVSYILIQLGYDYYVGTKYQDGRSLSAVLYLVASLFLLLTILSSKGFSQKYATFVYLGLLMIIFGLAFSQSSVISGRYSLVYMLIEPFIFYNFFYTFCKKGSFFYMGLLLLLIVFSCTKLLSLNLNL